jgi:predicted nucleic acid-binding protein
MPGDAYADSSFLVSLLWTDANHQKAVRYLARAAATLTFTPLHRVEVRNALRKACSFQQITDEELRLSLQQVERDLQAGLLIHTPVDWTNAFRIADDLSAKHARTSPQRTIDLLHVAIAIESGAKNFLSFDHRQRLLARAAGLRTNP